MLQWMANPVAMKKGWFVATLVGTAVTGGLIGRQTKGAGLWLKERTAKARAERNAKERENVKKWVAETVAEGVRHINETGGISGKTVPMPAQYTPSEGVVAK